MAVSLLLCKACHVCFDVVGAVQPCPLCKQPDTWIGLPLNGDRDARRDPEQPSGYEVNEMDRRFLKSIRVGSQ